jgi:8-oxo-dGTP diphosphatase
MKLRNMTSVYLLRDDEVLLLYRQGGRVVNNVWTGSAGGHFEEWELNDPEGCVLRELKEELGLDREALDNLRLRYITLRNTGDEIRQNYYFFAELKKSVSRALSSNEGISRWFPLKDILALDMPYTAKFVVEHFLAVGRLTDTLYVGTAESAGVTFQTLPDTPL